MLRALAPLVLALGCSAASAPDDASVDADGSSADAAIDAAILADAGDAATAPVPRATSGILYAATPIASPRELAPNATPVAGAPSEGDASPPATPDPIASVDEAIATDFVALPARDRARLHRAGQRAPSLRGRRASLTVDDRWIVQRGFPAIDRTGTIVALIGRATELCGEGAIDLLDVQTGELRESIPLPVSGSEWFEDVEGQNCAVDFAALRRTNRRLAREGFRALPAAREVRAGGASWWTGGGIAVRADTSDAGDADDIDTRGPVLRAYDAQTGELLASYEDDENGASLWAVPGARGLVLSSSSCGCRCGYSEQLWPR